MVLEGGVRSRGAAGRVRALGRYKGDVAACVVLLGANLFVYYAILESILTHIDDLLAIAQVREGIPDALQTGWLYGGDSSQYRPLAHLVYAADHAVFGVNGFGYQSVAFISWSVLLILLYALIRRFGVGVPLALLVSSLVSFLPMVYVAIFHADIGERINGIVLFLIFHLLLSSRATLLRLPSLMWGAALFLLFFTALAAKEFGIAVAGAFIVAALVQPVIAPGSVDGPRVLRWPLVTAGVASLGAYFTIRLVLDEVSLLGPPLTFMASLPQVLKSLLQPFLPLFDHQGQIVLGQLGFGWGLQIASSLIILPLAVMPLVWALRGSSRIAMSKYATSVPFEVVVLGLLIVFSAVLTAPGFGYTRIFLSGLAWAVLVSLGLARLWSSQRLMLTGAAVVAILALTTFNAHNAQIRVEGFRDYTLQAVSLDIERAPEESRRDIQLISEDLRREVAAYYCRTEPLIECPK